MIQRLSETGIAGLVLLNRSYSPDIDIEKMEVVSSNLFSKPDDYILPLRWVVMESGSAEYFLAVLTGIHDADVMIKLIMAGVSAILIMLTVWGTNQQNAYGFGSLGVEI